MTINLKSQISNLKSRLQRGFTLIELMVVLSITAVLGTLGIAGFVNFNQSQVLQSSASEVVTMLNLAKSRAQSQVKLGTLCSSSLNQLEGYRVDISISSGSYTLSSRCLSGVTELHDDLVTKTLPQDLSFNTNIYFFFPVQAGGAQASDPLNPKFDITNSGGRKKTITVNSLGGVSVQ